MKEKIHPEKRFVVFVDTSCGQQFRLKSSLKTDKKVIWAEDGKEYPMFAIETSSASHPVYTGKSRGVATEGRIAKFNSRFAGTPLGTQPPVAESK